MAAAEERRRADTGYDGPPSDDTNASALARLSAWSSAAGMQAFPPEEGADATLMLGGQVLVLDVTLAAAAEPTVKMSYAGSGEGRPSPAMDALFSRLVRGAVRRDGDVGGGRKLRDALGYLMRLDRFAAQEGNAGARWFGEVDALAQELVKITQEEAALLAQCVVSLSRLGIFSSRVG